MYYWSLALENFEHCFVSLWDECNCAVVWTLFGTAFLWGWNENWPFPLHYYCVGASQVVLVVKNLPANAGVIRDAGSISGLRRCPGGGHGNPIQSSCLENPMNRGAWWASVHRIVQSWTQLSAGGCTHALLYYDNDFHLKGWEIETQRVCWAIHSKSHG